MMRPPSSSAFLVAVLWWLATATASAGPVLLQVDDFEDGTTQGWFAGGGPIGASWPVTNVASGGPGGAGDNYLLLTSIATPGPGSRLVGMNASQWAGDYLAAGITAIELDAANFGNSDLALRLLFEDPAGGPPLNEAASASALLLPAGSGWVHLTFPIQPGDLTPLFGSVDAVLANTTVLRLYHSPTAVFPGPSLVASLGVDNISAAAAPVVPEPATVLLVGIGLAGSVARHRRMRGRRRGPASS